MTVGDIFAFCVRLPFNFLHRSSNMSEFLLPFKASLPLRCQVCVMMRDGSVESTKNMVAAFEETEHASVRKITA